MYDKWFVTLHVWYDKMIYWYLIYDICHVSNVCKATYLYHVRMNCWYVYFCFVVWWQYNLVVISNNVIVVAVVVVVIVVVVVVVVVVIVIKMWNVSNPCNSNRMTYGLHEMM